MNLKKEILNRNNTSYSIEIHNILNTVYKEYLEKKDKSSDIYANFLKFYQYFVRQFMTNPEFDIGGQNGRGLLIYHTMGMGKTYLAIAVAMSLWDAYHPLILLPKSLELNFRKSIFKLVSLLNPNVEPDKLKELKNKAIKRFIFMSLNANNVGKKISETNLNNRLLIVDEAHNLFRSIINSGGKQTNAIKIYESIMEAKNLKILFLTGTPCAKNPFEMVPCFNMLAGYELLPSEYNVWEELFISKDHYQMVNLNKLSNRLYGLISYATLRTDASRELFPEELPTIIENVEMSEPQYHKYLLARDQEKHEGIDTFERKKPMNLPKLSLPGGDIFGTYYVKSRMLGNYCNLPHAEGNINLESPKIAKLISNIEKSKGPVIVYSQFVENGGLGSIEKYLLKIGWSKFNKTGADLTFASITGKVSQDQQNNIIKIFNNFNNSNGSLIKILLVSKTGAEGLSLRNIRQVHILEPYWDDSRIQQLKARGIRLMSHSELPVEERTVQPYIYISIANKKIFDLTPKSAQEELTTDQIFYNRAIKNEKINNSFREILQSISIECQFLELDHCRVCRPTNQPLFSNDIRNDIKRQDPCKEIEELELDLHEITYKNKIYYYKKDSTSPIGYTFYTFEPKLNGIAAIDFSNPIVMELLDIINPFILE